MYPFLRFAMDLARHRRAPALGPFEAHVGSYVCWPWDIDVWGELNNGRALTLYDLGRFLLAQRTGLLALVRRERWAMTVAGVSVRYRRRVRLFHRVTMHSRMIGLDARFFYIEQSMWRHGTCCSHMLLRAAVTDVGGIVATERVAAALGIDPAAAPSLPDWAAAWIAAEAERPWPPVVEEAAQ